MAYDFETRCIHGKGADGLTEDTCSVSFPIYQTACFSHIKPGHNANGFDYTRESNPTRSKLEEVITALEGAADSVALSPGMAAISVCFELFRPGDHILCAEDLYGGVFRLHKLVNQKNGLEIDYADLRDPAVFEAAIRDNTRAVYLESPTNPMMNITDLRQTAEIAHRHGCLLIVDNTFMSPCFQQPLALGADIVVHSGTKFLGGHNDTSSGFVCARDPDLAAQLRLLSKTIGGVLAPFDCWLVLRGIKTLSVRMERQQANAMAIARWLKEQACVTAVYYPGLPEHPGHDVQSAQASGFGSMISFRVDSAETAVHILEHVRLITFAESLGGTESLLTYPVTQTHLDVPEALRKKLGIDDTLLRMSVGLESAEDLLEDLRQAMDI